MTAPARHLIAVDWGTSSLRAALLDGAGRVLDRRSGADGIMAMAGRDYPEVLEGLVGAWRVDHPGAPILMSGMVGSRQGWAEAPYVPCPAGAADLVAGLTPVEAGRLGQVHIVPGLSDVASGAPDVIRGEEVQVFGALRRAETGSATLVLPGTHSKWVHAEAGCVVRFRTFMTGEAYALLRRHSILGRLMPEADPETPDLAAFDRGAAASLDAPAGAILHALFSARTLGLFGALPSEALPGYLSGLLIGEEVREALALSDARPAAVHLIARPDLAALYARCLERLGIAPVIAGDAGFLGLFDVARAGKLVG